MKRAILFLVFSIAVFSQAELIRSALGSKGVEQTEDAAKWENPYITDGLVAMWDGYFNGKNGKHDPNGGLVEILSGIPTYLRQGSYTVEDDCIRCNVCVIASPAIPAIVALNGTEELTIEVVVSWVNAGNTRACILKENRPFVGWMFDQNSIYYMVHNACTDSVLVSKWASGYSNIRASKVLTISNTTVQWWLDGIASESATRTKNIYTTSNDFSIFGWDWDYRFPGSGEFCCLRIYNRQLTAEEIAYNYSIDKVRFNLK